jgi:hypothetical protein
MAIPEAIQRSRGIIQNKLSKFANAAGGNAPIMGDGFTMKNAAGALATTKSGMFDFLKNDANAFKSSFSTFSSARAQGTSLGTSLAGAGRNLMKNMGPGGAMRLGAYAGSALGAGVGAYASDEGVGNTAMGMALGAVAGAGAGGLAGHYNKQIMKGYSGAKLAANKGYNSIKSAMKG